MHCLHSYREVISQSALWVTDTVLPAIERANLRKDSLLLSCKNKQSVDPVEKLDVNDRCNSIDHHLEGRR